MRHPLYALCLLLPLGCAPEARWPQETEIQIASPDEATVVDAIATAVQWWMTREPTALSAGPVPVYVAPSLDPARPALMKLLPTCDLVDSETPRTVVVRAIRMHHMSAQVDIDAPRPSRGRQLITIDMKKYPLTSWKVTGANWWRFNDRQLDRITTEAVSAAHGRDAAEAESTDTELKSE